MKSEAIETAKWIDRLARALRALSKAQKPFLQEHWRHNPHKQIMFNGRDETPFPLHELRTIYLSARHVGMFGEHQHYAALRDTLDPVCSILRSHPTLWRVFAPVIDQDDFWVRVRGHGSLTSLTNVIGGLMARADELPGDGFDAAAEELHALLDSAGGGDATAVPRDLNIGYDAVLFHGLCLEDEIDIGDGMTMLPFERARAFVDEKVLEDMAPNVVKHRDWRLVGAVVKPFRWRPVLRRRGELRDAEAKPPGSFVWDALEFLKLLAVSHRVPIVCLMVVRECLSRSACHLLGQEHHHGAVQWGRPVHRFDPFAAPPRPRTEALAEARTAYGKRKSPRYGKLAPLVAQLAKHLPGTDGSLRKTVSWTSPLRWSGCTNFPRGKSPANCGTGLPRFSEPTRRVGKGLIRASRSSTTHGRKSCTTGRERYLRRDTETCSKRDSRSRQGRFSNC